LRKLAATGRYTSGYTARVITSTAPRNPCTQVLSDAQPKLTTKSGIASGTTTSTAHTRRPGRSVRSTNHAAAVPITAQSTVTTTVSRTVFHSRLAVSDRKIRCTIVEVPAPCASMSRNTSGSTSTTTTAMLSASSHQGRQSGPPGTSPLLALTDCGSGTAGAGVLAISAVRSSVAGASQQPGLAQQAIAVDPSPSSGIVIEFGCSSSKGVSGAAVSPRRRSGTRS
jgi:hypothetical protein